MEEAMRNRVTTLFMALAFGASLAGCGGDGTADSMLEAQVVTVQAVSVVGGAPTNPVDGANVIKFTMSGPGMSDVATSYSFLAGGGDLPVFPEGYDRQLTVEICRNTCDEGVGNDIIARGRTVPMKLPGRAVRNETVFVTTRNAFLPPTGVVEGGTQVSAMANKYRVGATMTELDDGTILIAGGAKVKTGAATWYRPEDLESITADAEVFDPRTGTFKAVGALNLARTHHAAVKLGGPNRSDGRVLVLGGYGSGGITDTIEIYNPGTGSFEMLPEDQKMGGTGRALFTAALAYPDQNILFLAGGDCSYKPAGGTWNLYMVGVGTVALGPLSPGVNADEFGTVRYNHTMTYLPTYGEDADGNALPGFVLMGGENDGGMVSLVEAYALNPLQGNDFSNVVRRDESALTDLPVAGRSLHTAVYVPGQGLVYVAGGFTQKGATQPTDRIDVYLAGAKAFNPDILVMASARGGVTGTLLDRNTVFLAGGRGEGGATTRTEVIVETVVCQGENNTPPCYRVPQLFAGRTPDLEASRAGHAALFDGTHKVLLVGGVSEANVTPDPILYNPE